METQKSWSLLKIHFKFETAVDLNKCLKQIELPNSLQACAPNSNLPLDTSTMIKSRYLSTLELFWALCMTLTFIPRVNFDTKQDCQTVTILKKNFLAII